MLFQGLATKDTTVPEVQPKKLLLLKNVNLAISVKKVVTVCHHALAALTHPQTKTNNLLIVKPVQPVSTAATMTTFQVVLSMVHVVPDISVLVLTTNSTLRMGNVQSVNSVKQESRLFDVTMDSIRIERCKDHVKYALEDTIATLTLHPQWGLLLNRNVLPVIIALKEVQQKFHVPQVRSTT